VEPLTSRELTALGIGLVLIGFGWTLDLHGPRGGAAALELEGQPTGAGGAPPGAGPSAGLSRSGEVGDAPAPSPAPRSEATSDRRSGATEGSPTVVGPRAAPEPSLEPSPWPATGLHVRVTTADGTSAVGAPIGVWVVGGRSPLALAECDGEGRVHFVDVPALAARYEVGLAAPVAPRLAWPQDLPAASTDEVHPHARAGLARDAPLELVLPRCGTLEVQVVRASRPGTLVELGQGRAAAFQAAQLRAAGADGVARFAWLPLGLELSLRVPFDEGALEVVVAGPDAAPDLGAAPAPPGSPVGAAVGPVVRRVIVGPEGVLQE